MTVSPAAGADVAAGRGDSTKIVDGEFSLAAHQRFLDEHAGLLSAGDTINTGPIYAQAPEADLAAFAASTARLADLADDVLKHGGFAWDRTILEWYAARRTPGLTQAAQVLALIAGAKKV